jgi:hypothetical protein
MHVRHSEDTSRPVGVRVEQLRLPHARSSQTFAGTMPGKRCKGSLPSQLPAQDAPVGSKLLSEMSDRPFEAFAKFYGRRPGEHVPCKSNIGLTLLGVVRRKRFED